MTVSSTEPSVAAGLPWIGTPLIESPVLSKLAGCRIFLKLENLQPSGSFKSRSIGNFVRAAVAESATLPTFYIASGGNAGLACVAAAIKYGCAAVVVVPTSTKDMMITKLKNLGATEVIQHGASWFDADQYVRTELMPKNAAGVYVPAFDHELLWEGASTLVDEMEGQLAAAGLGKADAVVCCVGGGSLFSGIVRGLDRAGSAHTAVVAVETNGCDSLNASVLAGEHVTLPAITSIATSLGAVRVADQAYEYAQRDTVKSVVVSDREAALACCRFVDDARIVVEPACGATLAVAYEDMLKSILPGLGEGSVVVLVVCGGSAISLDMLGEYKRTYA